MSPRKQKEKELTLDEALELARKELAPQWHLSNPLIAAVKAGERVNIVPLEDSFSKKDWIILFCDPTDFAGESAILIFKELMKRYQSFNLMPMIVVSPAYRLFYERDQAVKLLDSYGLTFTYVVDHENLISAGFRIERLPGIVIWKKNILRLSKSGPNWFDGLELEIQRLLREDDLGLPLWLPLSGDQLAHQDRGRIDFGSEADFQFPRPGFAPADSGFVEATFLDTDLPVQGPFGEFRIYGSWRRTEDRIQTTDSDAWIEFDLPSGSLGLFAGHLGKKEDTHGVFDIEIKGRAVPDVFAGPHLIYNDEGRSIVRVFKPGFFKVLQKLPASDRRVKIRFPYASQNGCCLYGFRFAE